MGKGLTDTPINTYIHIKADLIEYSYSFLIWKGRLQKKFVLFNRDLPH